MPQSTLSLTLERICPVLCLVRGVESGSVVSEAISLRHLAQSRNRRALEKYHTSDRNLETSDIGETRTLDPLGSLPPNPSPVRNRWMMMHIVHDDVET